MRAHGTRYAELEVTSNFTFLTGASHPEEMVATAAELGMEAVALTDTNTLGGIVRAHGAAKDAGLRFVVGTRVCFQGEGPLRHTGQDPTPPETLLLYPTSRTGYATLSRLLTRGKRRAPKGECELHPEDLQADTTDLLAVWVPPAHLDGHVPERLRLWQEVFEDDRLSLAARITHGPRGQVRLAALAATAQIVGVPLLATGNVHAHDVARRPLQDVLTCIRHGCTLQTAGARLHPHGERVLKPPAEMARLFRRTPEALTRGLEIVERTRGFSLEDLRYQYPDEVRTPGRTALEELRRRTAAGAASRYPAGVPEDVQTRIEHEFEIIGDLAYAPYFLTVDDIVRFARSRGILCQGRGAAANSAICYCLGVTSVDPGRITLLFERFVSRERGEPPDIDIDFEHERREEVLQYVYRRYGRDHAALTAEVITYRARSAIRDVGKAVGLSLDMVDRLARHVAWHESEQELHRRLVELGLDPEDPTLRRLLALCAQLVGFPRHRSQHVGGFVITRDPLSTLVPIENCAMEDRTVIEWEKDDIAAMGMMKVDLLGLGMLTCIRKAFEFLEAAPRAHLPPGERDALEMRLAAFRRHGLCPRTIPPDDPTVFDMMCRADTVGVFQIESRAQMAMLPRLRPRVFYDLVIEVAIVRPGPIHGGMVHPYLRRRTGEEPVEHFSEDIDAILGKTLGVPLFQEQAMALAVVAGGFTPGEADALRRAMAAWKRKGDQIARFGEKLIAGMQARGLPLEFAERCYQQIQGFSEYGFPESHAASFALIVYVSAWLKCYHPAAFAAALLNSQPMGFYAPAQIVRDAQDHGVAVRPVDVNESAWDCTLEYDEDAARPALRLGLRQAKGVGEEAGDAIHDAVALAGPFPNLGALHHASGVEVRVLRHLARAGAYASMGLDRQAALWHVRALQDEDLPLFEEQLRRARPTVPALPEVSPVRRVLQDYAAMHLSLQAHPLSFLREDLTAVGVVPAGALRDEEAWPHKRPVAVAGLVLSRQRPGTAKGVVFLTLEDETATANVVLWRRVFEHHWRTASRAKVLLVRGHIERQGEVVHVIAASLQDIGPRFADLLATRSRDFH